MKTRLCVAAALGLALASTAGLTGCGSNYAGGDAPVQEAEEQQEAVLDLAGTWKVEGSDPDSWQELTISGDVMTIGWVSDGGDTRALYWAGTYPAPTEPSDTWSWTSENDHEQTDTALMASSDETKDFEFDGEQISYSVSALGITKTVHAVRQ